MVHENFLKETQKYLRLYRLQENIPEIIKGFGKPEEVLFYATRCTLVYIASNRWLHRRFALRA